MLILPCSIIADFVLSIRTRPCFTATAEVRFSARIPDRIKLTPESSFGTEINLTRARKIKNPCPVCAASRLLCLCDAIPEIELRTRICLVIHHRELTRSSNTGLLAHRALVNSEVRVRGDTPAPLDLSDLLISQYRTFLLYPADDAAELSKKLVEEQPAPIQLIVPDGTWRQARKLHSRHAELKHVPRVKITAPNHSVFQLRAQHRPERMATLQAIAAALRIIEGDAAASQLMNLYYLKIERTLMGRGLLAKGTRPLGP